KAIFSLQVKFMSWAKLKTGIIIVLIILISEGVRLYTGLPITIIDIGLLPITCLLIYCMKYYKSPFSKTYKDMGNHQQQTPLQLIGFLLFAIILAAMGGWITWLGIQAPLQYFPSVKGAAHGYTLIQIGGVTALYSMWGALLFLFRLVSLRDKSA
ncbi:hypothetical protein ACVTOI_004568, partial [Vibrio parahaemolyticus]